VNQNLDTIVSVSKVALKKVCNTLSEVHPWYNCRALAVTAIAVHRIIATAIDSELDYG